MARWTQKERTLLSTHQVANILQVDPTSIINWIKNGLLMAQKTPGGHRRIHTDALIDFLETHKMNVPMELRRASKRVMWVDEDETYLTTVKTAVDTYENIEGKFFNSVIDALSSIGYVKPHMIVINTKGDVDGFEVLARLKNHEHTKGIKLALVKNSEPTTDEITRATELGAGQFVTKTADVDVLLRELSPMQRNANNTAATPQ